MPAIIVVISLTIGTTVGLLSGFKGGLVDSLLMRVVDIKSSFPGLLLTLAIIGMLGPGLFNAVIAMSISGWTGYDRIIRRMTPSFQETEAHNMRCSEGQAVLAFNDGDEVAIKAFCAQVETEHPTCAKEHPHDTSNKGNHWRYI